MSERLLTIKEVQSLYFPGFKPSVKLLRDTAKAHQLAQALATMKITMTLDEWEKLRDQLENKWPSSDLSRLITALLSDARRIFWKDMDDDPSR